MGHWNYRVVEKSGSFSVHEAFYDDGVETPHSITENEMSPYGETLEELKEDLEHYLEAFEKPVLQYKDF